MVFGMAPATCGSEAGSGQQVCRSDIRNLGEILLGLCDTRLKHKVLAMFLQAFKLCITLE